MKFLRARLKLVKTRTQVKNHIHSLLNKHGLRIPYKTPFSKKAVAWLRMQSLGFMDDANLSSDLAVLARARTTHDRSCENEIFKKRKKSL